MILDPPNDGRAAIPAAKLTMAWDACRKRTELEIENSAHRAANHLPPQLSVDDFPSARVAFEKLMGKEFDDHKLPSENYLEKKIGEIETALRAEKLTMVSSFAQEERQRTPNSVEQAMHFDSKGHPVMRTQKRDFAVQMPTDENSLRNRFEVMGAMLEILKMKYMSNGIIATSSLSLMKDYVEWLCGKTIWGYVVKGGEGKPISCPSLNMVLNYDYAVRELQHKLMKNGVDFKTALERAMADPDTRTLHFTTPFSMEATGSECRALSAPGLRERFGMSLKTPSLKRERDEPAERDQASESAKKRARKAARKLQAITDRAGQAPPPPRLALEDRRPPPRGGGKGGDTKGDAKGKGKGKKGALPKGMRARTDDDEMVCYSWNQNRPCKSSACTMKHVCWFCNKPDHRGEKCPDKPPQ